MMAVTATCETTRWLSNNMMTVTDNIRVPSQPSCRTEPAKRHVPETLAPSSVSFILSIPKAGLTSAGHGEARPYGRGGIGGRADGTGVHSLTLGSRQGNAHLHWHVAPLPAGVPYDRQLVVAALLRQPACGGRCKRSTASGVPARLPRPAFRARTMAADRSLT